MLQTGLVSHRSYTVGVEDTTSVSPFQLCSIAHTFPDLALLADVGASQMIIDGKIGLKNDSSIKEFTETGLRFENGSTLNADLVVFATGFSDYRDGFRKILGGDLGGKVKQIWGLDSDGEPRGAWRDIGVDNLWCMMGNLAMCRYHSRHVALREFLSSPLRCGIDNCGQIEIKAMKEGLFTERYSLEEKVA